MDVQLYGLKNCDTCRKALKSLAEDGFDVAFFDVRKDGVAPDLLARSLAQLGADKVLNTRSATWRGLSAAERARPPLELLTAHPALMKRPLIVAQGWLSVGWTGDISAGLAAARNTP